MIKDELGSDGVGDKPKVDMVASPEETNTCSTFKDNYTNIKLSPFYSQLAK